MHRFLLVLVVFSGCTLEDAIGGNDVYVVNWGPIGVGPTYATLDTRVAFGASESDGKFSVGTVHHYDGTVPSVAALGVAIVTPSGPESGCQPFARESTLVDEFAMIRNGGGVHDWAFQGSSQPRGCSTPALFRFRSPNTYAARAVTFPQARAWPLWLQYLDSGNAGSCAVHDRETGKRLRPVPCVSGSGPNRRFLVPGVFGTGTVSVAENVTDWPEFD